MIALVWRVRVKAFVDAAAVGWVDEAPSEDYAWSDDWRQANGQWRETCLLPPYSLQLPPVVAAAAASSSFSAVASVAAAVLVVAAVLALSLSFERETLPPPAAAVAATFAVVVPQMTVAKSVAEDSDLNFAFVVVAAASVVVAVATKLPAVVTFVAAVNAAAAAFVAAVVVAEYINCHCWDLAILVAAAVAFDAEQLDGWRVKKALHWHRPPHLDRGAAA